MLDPRQGQYGGLQVIRGKQQQVPQQHSSRCHPYAAGSEPARYLNPTSNNSAGACPHLATLTGCVAGLQRMRGPCRTAPAARRPMQTTAGRLDA